VWHNVALSIHWSKDATLGRVSAWFDGVIVVDQAAASTLADDNPHFIQLGILRDTISTPEKLVIDDAVHVSTADELLTPSPSTPPAPTDRPASGCQFGFTGSNRAGSIGIEFWTGNALMLLIWLARTRGRTGTSRRAIR
jgi:hypothetical protein